VNEQNRPVWVNGRRCNGVQEAAELAGFILGRKVCPAWIFRCAANQESLRLENLVVSVKPPASRPPLLRWPPGESPMERGPPHIWG
jgi:hypothetical protein